MSESETDSMAAITVKGITFAYNGTNLFESFDLSIEEGSATAVLGPSGIGKSTLAKLLVGEKRPLAGQISRGTGFASSHSVMYVDQTPLNSVFPWQTVAQNLRYPLEAQGWTHPRVSTRVQCLAEEFKLADLLEVLPARLSGGQLQRLALARSFSHRPRLVVLDETLSALDIPLREEIFGSIHSMAAKDGTTLVLVTHSVSDAISFATRCLVLGGRPACILKDLPIDAEFPRRQTSSFVQEAQLALLKGIRDGTID